jgi:hypothetical protein
MATVEFGNVSVDMRLTEDYGIPAPQCVNASVLSSVSARQQTLINAAALIVVRD